MTDTTSRVTAMAAVSSGRRLRCRALTATATSASNGTATCGSAASMTRAAGEKRAEVSHCQPGVSDRIHMYMWIRWSTPTSGPLASTLTVSPISTASGMPGSTHRDRQRGTGRGAAVGARASSMRVQGTGAILMGRPIVTPR